MNERMCECGCGEPIIPKAHHTWTGTPRFKRGHWARTQKPAPPPEDWIPPSGICACGCGAQTAIATRTIAAIDEHAGYPRRVVKGHRGGIHARYPTATVPSEVVVTGQAPNGYGYIVLQARNHPRSSKRNQVMEHRLVMERTLGRFLESQEQVHHKNGVRDDNRPENLELWKRSQPSGIRAADYHCPGCRCNEH